MLMMEEGETFGDSIIGTMSLFAYTYEGLGIAAIGLTKALAALKTVARKKGIDIKNLYEGELALFENKMAALDFDHPDGK